MPAKSSSQKNYMTLVYLYKKGKLDTSKFDDDFIEKIKKTADGISMKSVKHFAKTKTKDLPKKVKNENNVFDFQEYFTENVSDLYNFEEFLKEELTIEVDLELTNVFNKEYSYTELVLNHWVNILCEVNNISEKDFKNVDATINYVKTLTENNEEIDDIIAEFEPDNKRYQYCAERLNYKFLTKLNKNDN